MIDPPHPGRSIRENCLEPLGLSVTEATRLLGVTRHPLARGSQRPRGNLYGDGAPAGEGGLVECRVLALAAAGQHQEVDRRNRVNRHTALDRGFGKGIV